MTKGGGGSVCVDCDDTEGCDLDGPVAGPVICAKYLARAVAPASLEATLRSLRDAGAIREFSIKGGTVRLDADLTALEIATFPEAAAETAPAHRWSGTPSGAALSSAPQSHADAGAMGRVLGDDVERGFQVSSDIDGRRGATSARAADFEATRSYYQAASSFLMRSKSLKGKARRMWALHVQGLSEREIATRMGANRRKVQRQLDAIRLMAGIVTRRK